MTRMEIAKSIEQLIFTLRGHRVLLDADLARLYGVSTKRLNEQVKRNRDRFPQDFMFELTKEEMAANVLKCSLSLRSQFATLKKGRGQHRKYHSSAFTEHGAIMLANVLKSSVAVQTSIQVVRAFIRIRELAVAHKDLSLRLEDLEKKYDRHFKVVFDAIRQLTSPPPMMPKQPIGFRTAKQLTQEEL